jgi:transcriptional regulator with XRE-family HTH domain
MAGNNIKKIRKEKGLTQSQLGKKCGIDEANIRKYENGKLTPKTETLQKIALALQVDLAELDDRFLSLFHSMQTQKVLMLQIAKLQESLHSDALCEEDRTELLMSLQEKEENLKSITHVVDLQWEEKKEHDRKSQEEQILKDYRKLNDEGKKEAMKRVNELTEVPKYQKKD